MSEDREQPRVGPVWGWISSKMGIPITQVRQLTLMLSLALALSAGFGAWFLLQPAPWVPVSGSLAAADLAGAESALAAKNITNRTEAGVLMVAPEQLAAAQAAMVHAKTLGIGFEGLRTDSGFGVSQFLESARYQNALETELARSVAAMQAVRSARVHLAIPKPSPFSRDRAVPTASILLETFENQGLTSEQALAIRQMVAASVPDLRTDNVTLLDQTGHVQGTVAAQAGGSVNLPQEITLMRSRLQDLLQPFVAKEALRLQIHAEPIDANQGGNLRWHAVLLLDAAVVDKSPQLPSQVEALTKGIIGFDSSRGDRVLVQAVSFSRADKPAPTSSSAENSGLSWSLLLLPAFGFLAWLVWRSMGTSSAPMPQLDGARDAGNSDNGNKNQSDNGPADDRALSDAQQDKRIGQTAEKIAHCQQAIKQDPERVGAIVREWLGRDGEIVGTAAERTAVLLLALGEASAAIVLRYLSAGDVQRLALLMSKRQGLSEAQVLSALDALLHALSSRGTTHAGGASFIRQVLGAALDPDHATSVMTHIHRTTKATGLAALQWMPPTVVAQLLQKEHPQVAAVALSRMPSDCAAAVLEALPNELQGDILARITTLEGLKPEALKELDTALEKLIANRPPTQAVGGYNVAANIMEHLDPGWQQMVIRSMRTMERTSTTPPTQPEAV